MARRKTGNMNDQQFLGDRATMEVHDLDAETAQCAIDSVIESGDDEPFILLVTAHTQGYDNCEHCLKGSLR
ncbi:MAG: hypothetical protein WD873_02730 [Candidatus Hydrogenedentales bacterium]